MNISKLTTVFLLSSMTFLQSFSQPVLRYKSVVTSLKNPVDIVSAGDGSNRLFIVQKEGLIKVYDKSFTYVGDFLTVAGITTQGERGLLSMAFHPAYKTNGLFFVYYTNSQGNIEIAEYKVGSNPNIADPATKSIIITIPHPGAANHNGGKLNFGTDNYLYFATGDGGNGGDPPNNAQNGNSLLGKMLRIDVNNTTTTKNYAIPSDNPYVNDNTIADEIWAMGLRNPWRWSFDRLTQDMWIADVGQGAWEEINFRKTTETKGLNYGWRCYEGKHTYRTAGCQPIENYITPIFDYPHNNVTGGFSVTGGFVYRGSEYPSLNGYYIFADYVSGNQWMISDSSNVWVSKKQTGTFPRNISSFGESEDGSLYACSITAGVVYKIEATTGVAFSLLSFNGMVKNSIAELNWSTTENNIKQYEVQRSLDSVNFKTTDTVFAKNQVPENEYHFTESVRGIQKIFYRLRVINNEHKWDYSRTITLINSTPNAEFKLLNFGGIVKNNNAKLNWSAVEYNIRQYEVQRSTDSINFETSETITAKNQASANDYDFDENISGIEKVFYRLNVIDNEGNGTYSGTIALSRKVEFNLLSFTGIVKNNNSELSWSTTEKSLMRYEVQSSTDSVNFETKGILTAQNHATASDYHFSESIAGTQKIFYRLLVLNNDGNWDYSETITLISQIGFSLLNFSGIVKNNIAELTWSATEQNLLRYEVQGSADSVNFDTKKTISAKNQATSNDYDFNESIQGILKIFYRLRIVNKDGNWDYSRIISLKGETTKEYFIYPSFVNDKTIICFIPKAHDYLQIFNMSGALVFKKDIRGITGRIEITVPNLSKGIYMVKISNTTRESLQKIVVN